MVDSIQANANWGKSPQPNITKYSYINFALMASWVLSRLPTLESPVSIIKRTLQALVDRQIISQSYTLLSKVVSTPKLPYK